MTANETGFHLFRLDTCAIQLGSPAEQSRRRRRCCGGDSESRTSHPPSSGRSHPHAVVSRLRDVNRRHHRRRLFSRDWPQRPRLPYTACSVGIDLGAESSRTDPVMSFNKEHHAKLTFFFFFPHAGVTTERVGMGNSPSLILLPRTDEKSTTYPIRVTSTGTFIASSGG